MDRESAIAVVKLSASVAVAIALLLISLFGGDAWFRPIAIIALVVVVLPVALLVAIDTGRVLRRRKLGRAVTIATRLPQLLLGSVACVAGICGLFLAYISAFPLLARAVFSFISIGMFLYGVTLLRPHSDANADDASV